MLDSKFTQFEGFSLGVTFLNWRDAPVMEPVSAGLSAAVRHAGLSVPFCRPHKNFTHHCSHWMFVGFAGHVIEVILLDAFLLEMRLLCLGIFQIFS